ncbi:MAG: AI-2E family transporter [Tissierella sp.]|uniref:AI-2E family transporter n=1 Tax=Tissierella sp. TaxID=41274 RepID=UPI003F94E19D
MNIKTERMKKAMFLIVFTIFIWWIFENFKFVGKGFNLFLGIIAPFIIGLVISFILNKPMSFIEEKLFGESSPLGGIKDKYKRPISFFITLILFILVIAIVLILVVPNLVEAGAELADKLPAYWENIQEYIKSSSIKYSRINDLIQDINFDDINNSIYSFVKGGLLNWLDSTFNVFSSVVGGLISFGLGFVFSVYFLLQKEELTKSLKRLLYSVFPLNVTRRILYIGDITRESFSQFITGQTLDAIALGAMFFITMMIFSFPYALMVSIIIAISAFIPIVGSFIGLVIGSFLIFVEDPKMAGFFIILFFVLQQVEGNLIFPKVVGKASGLSSVWILAAVTLGGSLMGILGIIIFVPLFSVIQKLLKEYTDKRLEEKQIDNLE